MMMRRPIVLVLSLLVAAIGGCTPSGTASPTSTPAAQTSTTSTTVVGGDDFDQFIDRSFRTLLSRQPETATVYGLGDALEVGHMLNDLSEGYLAETRRLTNDILEELQSFDQAALDEDQRLTQDTFEWHLEADLARYEFRYHDWPVHFLVTSYNEGLLGLFTNVHPLTNRNQIDDYLERLNTVDVQVEQMIRNLETAVEMGIRPPAHVIDITVDQLRSQSGAAGRHQIVTTFRERVEDLGLNQATVTGYVDEVIEALEISFIPAWIDLADYLESVEENADAAISLSRLPDGDEFYEHLISLHTGTELSPQDIHELGLAEAARIRDEMAVLGAEAGFNTADPGELRGLFAQQAGFVADNDVLAEYSGMIDHATNAFEPFFSTVPSAPLEVIADPGPVAYYLGPPLDGSRPGEFHAGTGSGEVPRYTMRSLAHHEAVPGHHFQIALAQELEGLPLIQRLVSTTGHVEGWALYAERLASDVGLYDDDPASNFGRLDFELLRAARLVVDTGIHHLGWSRDQAITELSAIMGGPQYNHEVDRYAVYPGQATAYMVGMLRILELREAMGVDLEDPTSLAAFHDLIIGRGNVPLAVLGEGEMP